MQPLALIKGRDRIRQEFANEVQPVLLDSNTRCQASSDWRFFSAHFVVSPFICDSSPGDLSQRAPCDVIRSRLQRIAHTSKPPPFN